MPPWAYTIQTSYTMNKLLFFAPILAIVLLSSCTNDDDDANDNLTQEEELANLNALLAEIEDMASSVPCTDAADWSYTAYGDKACGGPVGYIAYPTTINTVQFLNKVVAHRNAQEAFNQKWEVASDCSLPAEPNAVRCEGGVPVFDYGQ